MSFHLFRFSLFSFNEVSYFSVYKCCISVKFIPRYLILFEATVKGLVLLISFSLLLANVWNTTDLVSSKLAKLIY